MGACTKKQNNTKSSAGKRPYTDIYEEMLEKHARHARQKRRALGFLGFTNIVLALYIIATFVYLIYII